MDPTNSNTALASAFFEVALPALWLLGMAFAVLYYVVPRTANQPLASGITDGDVLAHAGAEKHVVSCVVEILDRELLAPLRVLEDIHRLESLERVLAVEDARVVGALSLDE